MIQSREMEINRASQNNIEMNMNNYEEVSGFMGTI